MLKERKQSKLHSHLEEGINMEDSYAAAKIGQNDVKEIMSHHRDILEQAIESRQNTLQIPETQDLKKKKVSSWVEGNERQMKDNNDRKGSIGRSGSEVNERANSRNQQGGYMNMYQQRSRRNLNQQQPSHSKPVKKVKQEDLVKQLYFQKYGTKSTIFIFLYLSNYLKSFFF